MPETLQKFQYQGNDSLVLPACRENFTILQEWLNSIADTLNLCSRDKRQILISCDEIFTNIASYAYADNPQGGNVDVSVTFDPDAKQLQITISDKGIAFNPLDSETPDVTLPLSERKVGGLGLFMVKKMMDKVEYNYRDDRNILILTKSCTVGDK